MIMEMDNFQKFSLDYEDVSSGKSFVSFYHDFEQS